MIKNILFSIAVLAATYTANAQCVPNTNITTPGIYPDSATGLASGTINQAYNEVMQIKAPLDTVAVFAGNTVTVTIDSITLLSFYNLPPGLSYACNPTTCKFIGGSNGCVLLSGTPTQAGTFHPVAITSTKGKVGGFIPVTQIDTVDYYTIVINTAAGIANNSKFKFELDQNEPNPFVSFTDLKFTTPVQTIVALKVFNLVGKEILHKSIYCQPGKNSYRLDGEDFAPGVYMYTLSDGVTTYTRRMIAAKR